ncbi:MULTISPECIES: methionine ABC transporter permease [Enterococcus]|uniref:ABC transporter permease n=1 Tax=Enterococcus alcedinis TaxID=1274384 RepID=A0A917JH30_9ENTE|nr:methionine ABC transporter permease [Enterococcus alcedinis]MBP2102151.1 D-methionine transport system permease protein [Enterococcus alcedinis]GGI65712.1 ABC transporter permease [Enterococcus alcedinis]
METWEIIQLELPKALWETAQMVFVSTLIAVVIGGAFGLFLYFSSNPLFAKQTIFYPVLSFVVNAVRSLPFLILMVVLIPVAKWLIGDPYTPAGGTVSLTVAAIPFYARIAEGAFSEVDHGILEAAISTGASKRLIFKGVLLPEGLPSLIRGFVLTIISLIGYSAMVGTIGAGGVGDLAIQYGYYRYETGVLVIIIVILIIIVQLIQWLGDYLAKKALKK